MDEIGTILGLLILIAPWVWKAYRERSSEREEALGPGSFAKPDPTTNEPLEPR